MKQEAHAFRRGYFTHLASYPIITMGEIMGGIVAIPGFTVVKGRHTWLETIHKNNIAGNVIKPNSFYNKELLGKDETDRFKIIPYELVKARPLFTGSAFVIGTEGRSLGKRVENECEYEGTRKTTIFEADADQALLVDAAVLCDHAFAADGGPLIPLFDARTGRPVKTHEEMLTVNEVIIKFKGNVYVRRVQTRFGGMFENVGDEGTFGWVADSAAMGLVARIWGGYGRRCANLEGSPSFRFGVAVEAGE